MFNDYFIDECGKFEKEIFVNVNVRRRVEIVGVDFVVDINDYIFVIIIVVVDGGVKMFDIIDVNDLKIVFKCFGVVCVEVL